MKKTTNLIIAVLLLICLTLSGCNQPNTDTPPTSPSGSVTIQGGLEDNTIFDDVPSSGTSQPSTSAPSGSTPSTSQPSASAPATQPSTSVPTTQPSTSTPTTQPPTSTPESPNTTLTYEQFTAMTGAEQRAFQSSFATIDDFFAWYNAAKETYEKENPSIEIGGDGMVDLEGLLGDN